ncbi:hypothetical protein KKG65_03870 [Patescibacteria group bacterium]|nr:hypothetical protein [Patescibacteria group bacterium]
MIIESCTTNPANTNLGKRVFQKTITVIGYTALIAFAVITTITVIGSSSKSPTGSYLSPLPKGEIAQDTSSDGGRSTAEDSSEVGSANIKSTPELINLAQNYLDKAFALAKTPPKQTPEQKAKILENLDQSLSLTTQAISQDPRNPNGYVLRAHILTAVSNTNPNALAQAQKDLETAQNLSQGQPITLPETINPLNLLPDQQALANSDLILAAPLPGQVLPEQKLDAASNSFTTTTIIPAGQTEILINDNRITPTSYIYLIPETKTNASIFVKSKGTGQFTLATSTISDIDISINYYIINP